MVLHVGNGYLIYSSPGEERASADYVIRSTLLKPTPEWYTLPTMSWAILHLRLDPRLDPAALTLRSRVAIAQPLLEAA
ncbi:hypothetical protein B7463_g2311, partial [Scytalidium lignicola]